MATYQSESTAPGTGYFNLLGGLSSESTSRSDSSGKPVVLDTKQSDWLHQLSQMLGSLADQQYQWGLNQFAKLDNLTDQQVDNFLRLGDVGAQMAQGLQSRYDDTYAPLADQYAREAETYASPQRMMSQMGRAQAGVMQAGKQALDNAERDLEAYGIDPSSGRYQDLVRASHTANAAAAAAAGEVERARVEQEGARRREAAMAYGQAIPSQAVNALNSAFQGVSGAMNAGLGRANAGVALTTSAHPYYGDAMSLKYPPTGQNTTSQSRGQSGSINPGGSSGGGGARSQPSRSGSGGGAPSGYPGGRGGGGNSGDVGPAYGAQQSGPMARREGVAIREVPPFERGSPADGQWYSALGPQGSMYRPIPTQFDERQGEHPWEGYGGLGMADPFTNTYFPDARATAWGWNDNNWVSNPFGTEWSDPKYNQQSAWGDVPMPGGFDPYSGMTDPTQAYNDYLSGNLSDPYGGDQWNTGNPYLDASQGSNWGDTFNDYWGSNAPSAPQNYGSWDNWSTPQSDWYSQDMGGGYSGSTGWETPAPQVSNDWPSVNYADSGGGGWDDWSGDSGYWAEGGAIPDPMGGGHIPPQMSPSGGRQVDDVPGVVAQTGQTAMLNSDEFVIPRDVALWKGQEFFQSLIKKSREARLGAPAKPSKTKPTGQNPAAGSMNNGR